MFNFRIHYHVTKTKISIHLKLLILQMPFFSPVTFFTSQLSNANLANFWVEDELILSQLDSSFNIIVVYQKLGEKNQYLLHLKDRYSQILSHVVIKRHTCQLNPFEQNLVFFFTHKIFSVNTLPKLITLSWVTISKIPQLHFWRDSYYVNVITNYTFESFRASIIKMIWFRQNE